MTARRPNEGRRPIMPIAAIALGSNLGDRRTALASALDAIQQLPTTRLIAASEPLETDPVGPGRQGRYLNAATVVDTDLPPRVLLDHLLKIERSLGRVRDAREQWGPRTIDLDLLLYADLVKGEPGLTIPHPRMHERRFVLEPLASIAPEMMHPVLQRTVADLLAALA